MKPNITFERLTGNYVITETPKIDNTIGIVDKTRKKESYKCNNFGKGYLRAF